MSWKEALHEGLRQMLIREGINAEKVTAFAEDTYSSGYCDTCYYEEIRVHIYYDSSEGNDTYVYYGTLSELMNELDQ